jgi:nitrite reductase/ring-hydroxylating ferredoxin subunit
VTTVVLILSGDVGHHPLEARGVAFLVILVDQIGMNHFVNQGSLNLGEVIVQIPKQLGRQINLIRLQFPGLPVPRSEGFQAQDASVLVSTITSRCSHTGIPQNRKVGNLTVEMLIIQSDKHCFDIRSGHFHSPLCHQVSDAKIKMKNHANFVGTILANARTMPAIC